MSTISLINKTEKSSISQSELSLEPSDVQASSSSSQSCSDGEVQEIVLGQRKHSGNDYMLGNEYVDLDKFNNNMRTRIFSKSSTKHLKHLENLRESGISLNRQKSVFKAEECMDSYLALGTDRA